MATPKMRVSKEQQQATKTEQEQPNNDTDENEHQYSCDKEHVFQRYFSFPLIPTSNTQCTAMQNMSRPCPACSRPISLVHDGSDGVSSKAFEVQSVIPWGTGADRTVDNWNLFPLCSHHLDSVDELNSFEDDNDDRDDIQERVWGCSERLERAGGMHAFDWMREHYPLRLQEMCMRLQLAHGESFMLPAGESLCLRFVRDVYGEGRARIPSSTSTDQEGSEEVDPQSRHGEWKKLGVGFKSDLMDIAECFSEMTDREMLRVIDMKTKLATPRVSRRRLSSTSTSMQGDGIPSVPSGATPSSAVSRGVRSIFSASLSSSNVPSKTRPRQHVKRTLFTSNSVQRRKPDSDDDSDYCSADSDDDSDCGDDETVPKVRPRSLKRMRSQDEGNADKFSIENVPPNTTSTNVF